MLCRNFTFCRHFSAYASSYSLEKLYPKATGKCQMPEPSLEKFNGVIPLEKMKLSYSTSSGPGGQNVNKVETRVELRFPIDSADWIPSAVRERLADKFAHRMNKDGEFFVRSQRTRNQSLNLADALDKLRSSIRDCEQEMIFENREDTDEDKEILEERASRANQRRLLEKRRKSEDKQWRGKM